MARQKLFPCHLTDNPAGRGDGSVGEYLGLPDRGRRRRRQRWLRGRRFGIFFSPTCTKPPRSAAECWRIERARIGGKSGDHPRTQRVGNIEHDIVGSPVFDEGFQLIFQILRLLAGEARDRKVAMEACAERPLCRWLSAARTLERNELRYPKICPSTA